MDPVPDVAPADSVADDADLEGDADYQSLISGGDLPPIPGNVDTLEVDGTDDDAAAADSTDLNITGPITLAAWINPDSVANFQDIIAKGEFDDASGSFTYFILLVKPPEGPNGSVWHKPRRGG